MDNSKFNFVHGREIKDEYLYFLKFTNDPSVAAELVKVIEMRCFNDCIYSIANALDMLSNPEIENALAGIAKISDAVFSVSKSIADLEDAFNWISHGIKVKEENN